MGALSYHPAQHITIDESVHQLDFYANEVAKILQADYSGSLDEIFDKAGSSGGARPKVLVRIDDIEWLIKFKATSDPEDVGTIEYNYSLIAKKCGIVMPETRLFEGKYFGVQRFDRQAEKRIHVHSAAGLLYANHRLPSLDYTALLKATMALTRDFAEVEKVFRQMVFNVLIGNKDDHSKNFSFIYHNNSWKLSPAYDLLPSFGFNNNHTTTINGKGKPTIKDCIEVAKLTAFPVKSAERIIEEVKENVY
jgi:serine/threonine-protein kinase HipA